MLSLLLSLCLLLGSVFLYLLLGSVFLGYAATTITGVAPSKEEP